MWRETPHVRGAKVAARGCGCLCHYLLPLLHHIALLHICTIHVEVRRVVDEARVACIPTRVCDLRSGASEEGVGNRERGPRERSWSEDEALLRVGQCIAW